MDNKSMENQGKRLEAALRAALIQNAHGAKNNQQIAALKSQISRLKE